MKKYVRLLKMKLWRLAKNMPLPKYLSFVRWVIIDIIRGKKRKIFGIRLLVGAFGEGKTIGMVGYLEKIRKTRPDFHIYTNFGYKHETAPLLDWKEMLHVPEKTIIAIDELHNVFGSNRWKEFQTKYFELFYNLTQVRKKEIMFLCSTQDYATVEISFRRLSNFVIQCKNIGNLDRLFRCNFYDPLKYEQMGMSAKYSAPEWSDYYVAGDDFYELYDTNKYANTLKEEYQHLIEGVA